MGKAIDEAGGFIDKYIGDAIMALFEEDTVGDTSRIDSTIIGDAVNVAARIEGLTRNYESPILLTARVVSARRNPNAFRLRLVDKSVKVKGKDEAIAIYEILIL